MDQVRLRVTGAVARVSLVSGRGSSLTVSMVEELRDVLSRVHKRQAVRVLILASEGEHFCHGLDFGQALEIEETRFRTVLEAFADCLYMLRASPVPSLALVRGRAQGGGLGLAAACDLVLADGEAEFLLPEALAGLIPALITPILLQRMSASRIRALALSTRALSAQEARVFGLVDVLIEGGVERASRMQLNRLLRSSPLALAEIKRMTAAPDLQKKLMQGIDHLLAWMQMETAREGLRAAREGGLPPWWGRLKEGSEGRLSMNGSRGGVNDAKSIVKVT